MDVRHFARNRYRMAEISVPACPIPIQNTKVVMYIAHIWGVRFPAAPMPTQICHAQAAMPQASVSATRHIQAKYFSPGIAIVRMTSRLTSAQVAGAVVPGGALTTCPPDAPKHLPDDCAPWRLRGGAAGVTSPLA